MTKEIDYFDCEFCDFQEVIIYSNTDNEIVDAINYYNCSHKDNSEHTCILESPGYSTGICKFLT